ncbi:UNVERIFIED_CONTAM: hypothetical protein BEN50_21085 [Euhalothece sp. KZN 001]
MDSEFRRGDGYSKLTNENGSLAWGQSYLSEAYLDMYETTKNPKYLEKFVIQTDRLIANTDKNRNVEDYRGRLVVGWGATKYSPSNLRVIYLVHTGMITYPMVKFAMMVKNDSNLDKFQDKANAYVQFTEEALSVFDEDWMFNEHTGVGYYQFRVREQPVGTLFSEKVQEILMPLPFNQQLAAARASLYLCQIQGNESDFCTKATALAKHFRNRVRQDSKGFYVWDYWYGEALDKFSRTREDVSHGGIDIDFAILAHTNSTVFEETDIDKFKKTYYQISKNGSFARFVDGKGEAVSPTFIPLWMELSPYDCKPWQNFKSLLEQDQIPEQGATVMLGIAKLAKYYDICINKQL